MSWPALWLTGCKPRAESSFVRRIEWMERGEWVKADTHVHTRFSDGGHSIDEIAYQASRHGCDVIAITDHADRNLSAATPEYAEAIQAARRSHPNLMILAGLEWNVPPGGGDDHATLLVPPGSEEFLTLAEFKDRFDDLDRDEHHVQRAIDALDWLAKTAAANPSLPSPVIMLNHPSRKADRSTDLVESMKQWRAQNDLVVGFSGAPGHQKDPTLGAYAGKVTLMDRWDPAAARVGDAWDQLLASGLDTWAARAPSDFHGTQKDYWPGEFSETWLYVPERTAEGVLRAFKAGAFFAGHGHVARNVELRVRASGLDRPAYVGESIAVVEGTNVRVELELTIPPRDWSGQPNHVDLIELIAITADGARIIATEPMPVGKPFTREFQAVRDWFVLRARGRRVVADGPDLLFYTNPIRVITKEEGTFAKLQRAISPWMTGRRALGLGIVGLVVVSLVSLVRRGKPDASDPGTTPRTPPPSSPHSPPRRIHFFMAALGFTLLAVYGSLVPLELRAVTFDQAWEYFWHRQPWGQPSLGNRSDWGANVLLYVPISFCWLGWLLVDRQGILRKSVSVAGVLGTCLASSLLVEFLQCWCEARVPSHNDVYAQMLGGVAGIACWLVVGPSFTHWWRLHTARGNHQSLLAFVVSVYVLGLFIYSIIPFDLIIHPAELYAKYQQGRIQLVPRWLSGIDRQLVGDVVSDLLTYVPVGLWATIVWREPDYHRTWLRSVLIGGAVALAIETTQLFLVSRFSETGDLVTALIGIGIGSGLLLQYQSRTRAVPHANDQQLLRTLGWAGLAVLYAGFLFCFLCWPLDFDNDPDQIRRRWQHFFGVPMTALYWSSEYNAATQILRKLTLWGVLGALLSQAVLRHSLPPVLRRALLGGTLLLCAGFGLGVELSQLLLPSHVPDVTDVGLCTLGAGLGIWICTWLRKHTASRGVVLVEPASGSATPTARGRCKSAPARAD